VDRAHESMDRWLSGSPQDLGGPSRRGAAGARLSVGSSVMRGLRACRCYTKIEKRSHRSSLRSSVADVAMEGGWRQRGTNDDGGVQCGVSGGVEKRNKRWNEVRWGAVVLGLPFIGQVGERRGREEGGQRWSLSLIVSTMKRGEESTRCRGCVGEVEIGERHIDSTSSEHWRVATGGTRHRGASGGWR
jgi:hypothetical protein